VKNAEKAAMKNPVKAADHLTGIRAAIPIMVGYLPVAVAVGVAGVAAGLTPWHIIMMSSLIFAGGSQFILLASMSAGASWLWVAGICILVNARHLLYGPLLTNWLPSALRSRLIFAFVLTDEVFATSLSSLKTMPPEKRIGWLRGLGVGAYCSWVLGTTLGALTGEHLEHTSPLLAQAMKFSLPALFVALAWQCVTRKLKWPLTVSALVAAGLALAGHGGLAIVVGGFAGTFCYWRIK
jgi:4-azaleucine resistance transporter AzlC